MELNRKSYTLSVYGKSVPHRKTMPACMAWFVLLCLAALLASSCTPSSSEPKNLHDMLVYVGQNYEKDPQKTFEIFTRFGESGEKALILAVFNIAPEKSHEFGGNPFYQSREALPLIRPALLLVKDLCKDVMFQKKTIALSNEYRKLPPQP